ncbi:hypothetical protein XarbCFBP8150_04565 [Xanthomonas arboricola]|nr:hypothetical protein XarbCFBP8150_04565 [Xanthomonas arboricola]
MVLARPPSRKRLQGRTCGVSCEGGRARTLHRSTRSDALPSGSLLRSADAGVKRYENSLPNHDVVS